MLVPWRVYLTPFTTIVGAGPPIVQFRPRDRISEEHKVPKPEEHPIKGHPEIRGSAMVNEKVMPHKASPGAILCREPLVFRSG